MRDLKCNLRVISLFMISAMGAVALQRQASAEVRLPGFFGDHMVLQQGVPIRVWGWAEAGEPVRIAIGDSSAEGVADASGKWNLELPPRVASNEPLTVRISGSNSIELNDVLVGEVWLCSGQSNMEWTVGRSTNAAKEIADGDHPRIRQMKVAHRASSVPLDDIDSEWLVCSPDVVGDFTACGYFMAKDLQSKIDVPIGLINSSWGGTRVEPWTAPGGFENVEALESIFESVEGRTPGTKSYRRQLGQHIDSTEAWLAQAVEALKLGEVAEASPSFPNQLRPFTSHQDPTMLYNGMIHALVGFPMRGAIWYQGEANHAEGMLYYEKKKALIGGWRELWGQGDFPFYFVQIAPFRYGNEDPSILARFWEAQAAVEQLPNTGMVVVNDIATIDDIHPPNKQDVGSRLALLALKNDYEIAETVADRPVMKSMELEESQLVISFANTAGGLTTRDGNSPSHFEVIGPSTRGFQPADAKIVGDSVVLSSPDVERPVAFRYAWNKIAEPNLTGATGLPVGAFRGGEVPDFLSQVSVEEGFELVYDLDLSKMGSEIDYDVDRSNEIGTFDRIGYLLELESPVSGPQSLFVAVDPFTQDAKKIGIPTASSGANFQQPLSSMEVFSNVSGVTKGLQIEGANIEFWPNNYSPNNAAKVPGASNSAFDFGDDPGPPLVGYGSMQIHNPAAKQTVFAINHWGAGSGADIGIGNHASGNPDWTFSSNAGSYSKKRLRVYVRPN